MSRRPRFLPPPMEKRVRPPAPIWAARLIIGVAVAIVVAALIYTIATGTLFTAPNGS